MFNRPYRSLAAINITLPIKIVHRYIVSIGKECPTPRNIHVSPSPVFNLLECHLRIAIDRSSVGSRETIHMNCCSLRVLPHSGAAGARAGAVLEGICSDCGRNGTLD